MDEFKLLVSALEQAQKAGAFSLQEVAQILPAIAKLGDKLTASMEVVTTPEDDSPKQ